MIYLFVKQINEILKSDKREWDGEKLIEGHKYLLIAQVFVFIDYLLFSKGCLVRVSENKINIIFEI